MTKPRIFISFDFDHDEDLRNLLVGQSKNEDSPFDIADWSLKEPLSGDWKDKIRTRIKKIDQVIVICGEYTNTASGVNIEIRITQEEEKPYFLLGGRKVGSNKKPKDAKESDKLYKWTWENLKTLIGGAR